MSADQDAPPPLEEAPPSLGEGAPPPSADTVPPSPGEEAPPLPVEEALLPSEEEASPSGEEAPPPPREATSADVSPSERGRVRTSSDYLNLIPSDERIIIPDDDEPDPYRVRPRPTLRTTAPSVLSEMLSPSSQRSSKYLRSLSGISNLQETLKERQVLLIIRFFICVTFISSEIFWWFSS